MALVGFEEMTRGEALPPRLLFFMRNPVTIAVSSSFLLIGGRCAAIGTSFLGLTAWGWVAAAALPPLVARVAAVVFKPGMPEEIKV